LSQYGSLFGDERRETLLGQAVHAWFANGGGRCVVVRVEDLGALADGLSALETADDVTIVAAPDVAGQSGPGGLDVLRAGYFALAAHCERMLNRLAILDPPPELDPQGILEWSRSTGLDTRLAALYYPWIGVLGPDGRSVSIPPSGHIAGTWARNDDERGVWTPPANLPLQGVVCVAQPLTREHEFVLGQAGINTIRSQTERGIRVWGARTLSSSPTARSIATVRLTATLGTFVPKVTAWAAFEPPGPRTWKRLRSAVEAVLEPLWRRGAFAGDTAADAFYIRADEEVNPPELAAAGRIRVEFGFAATTPGEFVQMSVEQPSGDVAIYES